MKRYYQWIRHSVQLLVIIFILSVPIFAQYAEYVYQNQINHILQDWPPSFAKNSLHIVEQLIYKIAPSISSDQILSALNNVVGNAWSIQIFGISITDPLAILGSIASSKSISLTLIIGMIIPVIATLILGRIYCSWFCPIGFILEMSAKLKTLLHRLNIRTKNIIFGRGSKYILLIAGLIATYILSTPLLNDLYPPALIGQEIHNQLQFLFEEAENNNFDFSLGGLTGISLFIISLILIEIFISRRMWCRYICPGGALYSLLGTKRVIRIRRNSLKCTDCGNCTKVCPMGLNPMKDSTGIECDNCLACVTSCSEDAIHPHLSLKSTSINEKK